MLLGVPQIVFLFSLMNQKDTVFKHYLVNKSYLKKADSEIIFL